MSSRDQWNCPVPWIVAFHTRIILSMHHCIRVVTETEGVKFEVPAEGAVSEVTQGLDICGTDPESTLYALQGKPRFIKPLSCDFKIFSLNDQVKFMH